MPHSNLLEPTCIIIRFKIRVGWIDNVYLITNDFVRNSTEGDLSNFVCGYCMSLPINIARQNPDSLILTFLTYFDCSFLSQNKEIEVFL